MRETLYQLTLTLALPIAVGAVWIARAEPVEPPARERATGYRIELSDLPLPIRERLRTPGFAAPMPVARSTPEESAPLRERSLFEEPPRPAPAPFELAARAVSKRAFVTAPSPRAVAQPLDTLAPAPRPALRGAPPIALTASSLSSRRGTAASTLHPATSALPGPGATGKPNVDSPAAYAEHDRRIFERRRLLNPAQDFRGKFHPFASASGGIDPDRPERFVPPTPYRNTPLLPSDPIDSVDDFSLPMSDLPRYEEPVKTVTPVDPDPVISEPTPVRWSSLRPTFRFLPIPEPGSAILLGASLATLGALRRGRLRV